MNKNKEKKVNFLTPFFGAVQGKLPRYMADFFWIALGKDNVEFGLKINKEGFNFIYPIEFCPTPRRDKVIFLGPDSILLLFKRAIISREQFFFIKMLSLVRFVQYLITYKILDRNVPIITVGQDDAEDFISRGFRKVFYLRHPVEPVKEVRSEVVKKDHLVIGISGSLGKFNKFYCGKWYRHLTLALSKRDFSKKIQFSLLGSQYSGLATALSDLGYTVYHDDWVDDYDDFIQSIDTYMSLLAVGAGTKNRVLAANAAGLRVIGTPFALENVDCNGNLCVSKPQEIEGAIEKVCHMKNPFLSKSEHHSFLELHDRDVCLKEAKEVLNKCGL
jgi:hypothetical protein